MQSLTPRQQEILELVAQGMTSAEIAARLHRSIRTIESHRLKIGQLLGAKNSTDLIRKACAVGILRSDVEVEPKASSNATASVEQMLSALGIAATSSRSGRGLLQSICHQIVSAFGSRAAAICRVTESGRVQAVAAWASAGEFDLPEWRFASSPCARLRWAEVITVPYRDLPSCMAESFSAICGEGCAITIVPLHRKAEVQLGVLCLVHPEELNLASGSRPLLYLCSAWITSELCKSVYREDLEAIGFNLGTIETHADSVSFRCRKDGQLVWVSSRIRDIVGKLTEASTTDVFSLLDVVAGGGSQTQIRSIKASLATHKGYSTSFESRNLGVGRTRVYLKLEPVSLGTERSGDFAGVLDFGGRSEPPMDESTFLGALQVLVSKHPDPCVLIHQSGDIIAASSCWRSRLHEHGVLGLSECGNYLSVLRRIGSSRTASCVETELRTLGDRAATRGRNTTVKIAVREDEEIACIGPTIELTPIPGSERVFIRHGNGEQAPQDPHASPMHASMRRLVNPPIKPEPRSVHLPIYTPSHTFDWMFNHSPHLMCVCSLRGVFLRVNSAMCKALECTSEELERMPHLNLFYPQDHVHVQELINRLSAGRSVEQALLPMRTPRGSRLLIEWSCPPVLPGTDLFTPIGRLL